MRIAIVGGGLAGGLLAWRLAQRPYRLQPELFAGDRSPGTDATGASGGLTRAFEPDPIQCIAAAESVAEMIDDPVLRAWAGFREVGATYVLGAGTDPGASLATVTAAVPGSARVVTAAELAATHPFRGLPEDAVCVVERRAGYISPDRLRASAIGQLVADGLVVHREAVSAVLPGPAVRVGDGRVLPYDAVVVAAGAWTPSLLRRSGLRATGLRTKQIQYVHCRARLPGLGAFVDETSGLYGRPTGPAGFLLGLPCDRWDTEPGAAAPDALLAARVREQGAVRFGPALTGSAADRVVAAVDCFSDPAGLRLRRVQEDACLFTFTGGSGASAKTALAASRAAAAALAS